MVQKRIAQKHHRRMSSASSYTSPSKAPPSAAAEAYVRETSSECSFPNELLELSMQTISDCGSDSNRSVAKSDCDPVKSTIFDAVAIEVWQHNLCPLLTPKDLCTWRQTCKSCKRLVDHEQVWTTVFETNWPWLSIEYIDSESGAKGGTTTNVPSGGCRHDTVSSSVVGGDGIAADDGDFEMRILSSGDKLDQQKLPADEAVKSPEEKYSPPRRVSFSSALTIDSLGTSSCSTSPASYGKVSSPSNFPAMIPESTFAGQDFPKISPKEAARRVGALRELALRMTGSETWLREVEENVAEQNS